MAAGKVLRGGAMAARTKLTRAKLHDLVWSQPMKDLPEVVGVSATSVKNACRKFDIPIPDRGHWAKIKAGRSSKQTSLPDRAPGMSPGCKALLPSLTVVTFLLCKAGDISEWCLQWIVAGHILNWVATDSLSCWKESRIGAWLWD